MLMCSPSSSPLKAYLMSVIVFVVLLYESNSSSLLLTAQRNERSRLNIIVRGIYFREETYLIITDRPTVHIHKSQ